MPDSWVKYQQRVYIHGHCSNLSRPNTRKRKVARLQSHMSLAIMTILVEDILR
ncbi:hypothetical protein HBI56_214480 [Parastagonospora nodorum]|nr:hypothetical protein HBH56_230440 [Parastagonospora nodorum]KAH3958425.1 hypothetical protein HBH51_210160 [Parastagonospora nodorum]KAH3960291.1 hypothetical protein HBH52_237460 [Parastagonospora nodorum]KAH3993553.1 hypothetical protein HBI10_198830 [Parastagonospora nodorum]KAH4014808.1 hypothetical protein HBI09_208910 [Parastagonospora nodorum]